ncbi:hypothetical protein AB5N19_05671 [Seiridium cardinale]|uniref:Extracellular serine-rich protein n=1 Tax=Seiridium cardinale TaxID=138064 RepID=A0ABR2XJG0_9PEZI
MAGEATSVGQSATDTTSTADPSVTSIIDTSSSASRVPTTTTVSVGANHDYNPDTVTALPGDVIKFIFYPTNHSVVRAAYQHPCIPYDYVEVGGDTFFSGPEVSDVGSEQPEWLLTVNDTDPYFFYCSAPGSCINSHMVGVINPNENFTLDAQKEALKDVQFQLSPGEPFPPEASLTASTTSATSTATGSSSGSGGTSLSGGAIAGIAIGGAAVLIIAVALIWFCGRKGGIEKGYRKSTVVSQPPPSMVEANYATQPKSPPPPTYRDSPYGPNSEALRSASPGQWSQTGSPHTSYAGYPSPGLVSTWSEVHGQSEQPKPTSPPPPVELMGNTHHPGSPPPGRHEFPG